MTDNQENKLSMGLVVQNVVNSNNVIWSGLPAFVSAFNDFEGIIVEILSNRVVQEADTKGVTLDKQQAEDVLIAKTLMISSGTYAYAVDNSNETLREKINYSPSNLRQARDTILRDMCQLIHDEVNAEIGNLADYGVLPADLTDLQNKIDLYYIAISEPREAITDRKTATQELVILLGRFDDVLTERMDKLMVMFRDSHPLFYRQYVNARMIVDLGGGPGEPEPEVGVITCVTDQSVLNEVEVVFKNNATGNFEIIWGDGDTTPLELEAEEVSRTHDYALEGTYTIEITGDLDTISNIDFKNNRLITATVKNLPQLTHLRLNDNNITDAEIENIPEIIESYFENNSMTEETVNNILIAYDDLGTHGGLLFKAIYLQGGTNASPTGDGLVAKANLESRGWVVQVAGGAGAGEITCVTDQSVLSQVTVYLSTIDSGEIVWGDGDITPVTAGGNFTHDYVLEGIYTIEVRGVIETLTYLYFREDQLISATVRNLPNLSYLRLNSNNLTDAVVVENIPEIDYSYLDDNNMTEETVNNILIAYDSMGTSNGYLYLWDGTNASPTGDGIVARDNLISRGWSVHVN